MLALKPLNKKTIVEKNKFSRKLMVWAGVAYNLKNDLVFFRQGETVNADRYQSAILAPFVVPLCRQHNLVFQQDSAPCHTATRVAESLRTENIDFGRKKIGRQTTLISIPLTTVHGVCWSRRCTVGHQRIRRTWRAKFDELNFVRPPCTYLFIAI